MLECNVAFRGFDCTTFPQVLFELQELPKKGTGSDLADALEAKKCEHENIPGDDLKGRFIGRKIPAGYYIVFNNAHFVLYDATKQKLYEFNKEKNTLGGFRETNAGERTMATNSGGWSVRKLPDIYAPKFA